MSHGNRRDFLKATLGTAGAIAAGCSNTPEAAEVSEAPAAIAKKSATDLVKLGNSNIEVTRLALGTGTYGGRVQRELPQEEFTKIVRHAYDRGVRFFESADSYNEMHERLAIALKGIPRDSYKLMTKFRLKNAESYQENLDRMRKELNSEYFDILLMHCVRTADWPTEFEKLADQFNETQQKKIILAKGASCHGLLPLRAFPGNKWLEVALLRINHDGTRMDMLNPRGEGKGDVNEVVSHINTIHGQGVGVLGMKIMGEGAFKSPEVRDESIKFVMQMGTVDSVTIGFKNTAEVDEAIDRMNTHLNAA